MSSLMSYQLLAGGSLLVLTYMTGRGEESARLSLEGRMELTEETRLSQLRLSEFQKGVNTKSLW